jgi:carboxylesterase type B
VPYVFGTLATLDRPWEPVDRKLSDTVSSYWTNFAKNGNPNAPGLVPWRASAANTNETMQLGARVGMMPEAEAAKLTFFLSFLKK